MICPFCNSSMVMANDNKIFCYDCRKQHNAYTAKATLLCQECSGSGEYIEDAIDFGDDWCGPIMQYIYATCGWCNGTGKVTPEIRGEWLRWRKSIKAMARGIRRL